MHMEKKNNRKVYIRAKQSETLSLKKNPIVYRIKDFVVKNPTNFGNSITVETMVMMIMVIIM